MPGYILHLTEAKLILDELKAWGFAPDDRWVNAFMLGNLLPDTKKQKEKVTSHFWNPEHLKNLAIAPDLNRFLKKYEKELMGPLMLGYFTHLHLDTLYVEEYWDQVMEFLNESDQRAVLRSKITQVRLKQKNQVIPACEFFTPKYYYGDYSRMNSCLQHKYQVQVPTLDESLECPVREVRMEDLSIVLTELQTLMDQMETKAGQTVVFDMESLEEFIQMTAIKAAEMIKCRIRKDCL